MEEVGGAAEERVLSHREQESFGALLEALPGAAALLDAAGRLLLTNRAFARSCGVEPGALAGRAFVELVVDGQRSGVEALLARGGGEAVRFGATLFDSSGGSWPSCWRLAQLAGEAGWRVLSRVDRPAWRPSARAHRELEETSRLLRVLFKENPAPLVLSEAESGRLLEVNHGFERLTGYSRRELLGRTTLEIGLFSSAEERRRVVEELRRGTHDVELQARRKGGEPYVALVSSGEVWARGRQCLLEVFFDITERKRVERELEESQRLLAILFDQSPVAIALSELHSGRHLEVNHAFETVTGYRREEIVGHTSVELGLLRSGEERARMVERSGFGVREEPLVEVSLFDRSGAERVGLMSVAAVRARGRACLLSVFQDITARKQIEAEKERLARSVAEHQAFLLRLLESIPVALVYVDRDLVVRLCNTAAAAQLGMSAAELKGRRLEELPGKGGPTAELRLMLETRRAIPRRSMTVPFGGKGEERSFASSATPDLGPDGEVRGIFLEASDVTPLFRVERDLQTERAIFTSAFEILPIPSLLLGPAEVLRVNAAAHAFREQQLLAPWHELPLREASSGLPVAAGKTPWRRALEGASTPASEFLLEAGNGRRVPVLVSAGPVRVEGKVVAAMVAIEDVSPLKAADRIKDEFLATVSHDLRSPLSAIQGWAQFLRSPHPPAASTKALDAILRAAATQRRLIDDLLDASALAAGVLRVLLAEQDLVPLIEDVIAGAEPNAALRRIELVSDLPHQPLLARVDAVRVRQIGTNLVDNALKATPEGGRVVIRLVRSGEEAVLEVRDSGRGIAPADLPQLFDRFFQAPGAPVVGKHLGLGLAIAWALVGLHGGSVSAFSEGEGRGATFTVRLPALP